MPLTVRGKNENTKAESGIVLQLKYLPPFDGDTLFSIFRAHQLPELETVTSQHYERVFHRDGRIGYFRVSHNPGKSALTLIMAIAPTSTRALPNRTPSRLAGS